METPSSMTEFEGRGPVLSRRTFVSMTAAGALSLLLGCSSDGDEATSFEGTVIVVGAGPAGMTAAHLLNQRGVEFEVLEAAPTYGGRIKHDTEFTDFPISLGGEWLHTGDPGTLDDIVNDPDVEVTTKVVFYGDDASFGHYEDGELTLSGGDDWGDDMKFVGSSWLDFFETYLVPGIEDRMVFDTQVVAIDHTGDTVRVNDAAGTVREADRVIVAAPMKVLQRGDIEFRPPLPDDQAETLQRANIWSGLKAFIEFSEEFYPSALSFADSETLDGQRLYYDAAYGQDSDANILGLFSVGAQAEAYQALSADGLRDRMLAELDEVFDGAASRTYVRHIVQNWNDEPYIGAAYLADVALTATSRTLSQSIDDRIYFAGASYTRFDDWSSVHTAARSAADAVDELLG
ncbi:MAG: FAD-dependent oxidoreductase [Actinomycetota bacterium]